MRRCRLTALVAGLLAAAAASAADEPALTVIRGVSDAGEATPIWSAMLRARLSPPAYEAARHTRRPLTPAERAWAGLIESRAAAWRGERAAIERPYAPAAPPTRVSVVVGHQAASGDDAFTHDATTIGFDLGELQTAYGDAGRAENRDRIDRFFRHEYAHLMQRAWLAEHPWPAEGPLAAALLEIWKEGLGNYHSLSARWRAPEGGLSELARRTLDELEPRFAARLAAVSCAAGKSAEALTADLSRGRFDRKWGALPVALWLASEPGDPEDALRAFVRAGPAGVWDLARRRSRAPLAAVLDEARQAALRCETGAS